MNHLKIKKIFVFSVCLCLPFFAFAEGETLSLVEARRLALANSRSLAKYNMNVRSSSLEEKTQGYA
jgi:hypothetical protein